MLNQFHLPLDGYLPLVAGIEPGTTSIFSNCYFNQELLIVPVVTSTVVLAPSTNYSAKFCAKGNNWVTGSKTDHSAYRTELAGVIAAFTMLDVLVHHHNLTSGTVTIALDGESALIPSGSDWPLSVDQPSFDYLQVISSWTKLLPLEFNFRYI